MPSSDESRIERRKQEVRDEEEGSKVTTYVDLGGIAVVVVAVLFFLLGGGSTSSDGTDVSAFEGVKTVPNDDPTLVSRNFSSTGGSDGAVKVVYFGDFQCPHLPKLVENYVKTGDVRFVFKPYPVVNENSFRAIHAAYEVWNQNRQAYWEWHRLVFENQRELARQNSLSAAASKLADYARQVGGVDASKVESAVTNQRYSEV
ncbi:MAG: DsbA family protein, partial [Halobacteria archaeon]|nr:DsbA family protein [Halobacteria archaeon]